MPEAEVDRGEVGSPRPVRRTAPAPIRPRRSAHPPRFHASPRCPAPPRRAGPIVCAALFSSARPPSHSSTTFRRGGVAVTSSSGSAKMSRSSRGQRAEHAVQQADPAPARLAERVGDDRVAGVGGEHVAVAHRGDRGQRRVAPDHRDRAGQVQGQRLGSVDERLGGRTAAVGVLVQPDRRLGQVGLVDLDQARARGRRAAPAPSGPTGSPAPRHGAAPG